MKIRLWQARWLFNTVGMTFACSFLWTTFRMFERQDHTAGSLVLAIATLTGLSLGMTACLTILQRIRAQQQQYDAYKAAECQLETLDLLEAKLAAKKEADDKAKAEAKGGE